MDKGTVNMSVAFSSSLWGENDRSCLPPQPLPGKANHGHGLVLLHCAVFEGGFVHFKGHDTNRQSAAPLIAIEELCGCGQQASFRAVASIM